MLFTCLPQGARFPAAFLARRIRAAGTLPSISTATC